jgi:hypothetical protein
MTKISPRFFVLPLIAVAVIVALPRPAATTCALAADKIATVTGKTHGPAAAADGICPVAAQRMVGIAASNPVR